MVESQNRIIWVDFVRVIATFAVILLHTVAPMLIRFKDLPGSYWMTANIYDSAVRMSVPLFFMISGLLLLEKQETLKVFFKKRISKVVIPLICWSIFYIILNSLMRHKYALSLHSFYSILFSPAYFHLWFLYAIIGVYLYMPILRIIIAHSGEKLLYYFIALWFLAVAIIPIGEKVIAVDSRIDLLSISGYSGYLVLGLILGKRVTTGRAALKAMILSVLLICITAAGTYFITVNNDGIFDNTFYQYLSPNIIIFSCAVFVLIKYIFTSTHFILNKRLLSLLSSFSSASFGIYLIHMFFLAIIRRVDFGPFSTIYHGHPVYSVPLMAFTVFILSYFAVVFLKRVPYLRISVP